MSTPDRRRGTDRILTAVAASVGLIATLFMVAPAGAASIGPAPTAPKPTTSTPATAASTPDDQPAGAPGTRRAGDDPDAIATTAAVDGRAPNLAADPGGLPGIDVANFQHPSGAAINWGAVAASGRRYALVKATEGPIGTACTGAPYTNPYFRSDYDAAGAAGMWRGAYHYAHPRLPLSTADQEAQQFVSVAGVPGASRELPPVLDIEQTCGLGPADTVAWVREWLERVRSLTGQRPIVYSGYYFWQHTMGGDTSLANAGYPLWMARYQAAVPEPLPGGWRTWSFWQWTSSGSVPGIASATDLDVFQGDESGLQALVVAAKGDTPSVSVDRNLDGRAEALWVDSYGSLWQRWEVSPGSWSGGWMRWSTQILRATLTHNVDGRLEAFAIRRDGVLMHSWQTCAGCGWSGWFGLGTGYPGTALAAAPNADGHLEVVTRQSDGWLVHTWQSCAGCDFIGWWYALAPPGQGPVAMAANQDGRLEVFGTTSGQLDHTWQVVPNGTWTAWLPMAPGSDSSVPPTAALGRDGRLVIGWRNSVYGTAVMDRQSCPGCGWDPPSLAPIGAISSGPVLSTGGPTTSVAACGSGAVGIAAMASATGQWTSSGPAPAPVCRNLAVLGDRPGPLVLVWADNLLAASPGHATAPF
jgi:GH25 family lysozyme M1 (1,4-beta-N-acetylmuramidase)